MSAAPPPTVALARYDAACRALAAAKTVDDVKGIRDMAVALRAYARQAKNKSLEADAWEIRTRAERRVAELMRAQRETVGLSVGAKGNPGGHGAKVVRVGNGPAQVPTYDDAGIDKHLADRARKILKLEPDAFEAAIADGRARIQSEVERVRVDIAAPKAHVGENSGDHEWYTPVEFIEPARKVLGAIDLDPASCAAANQVVQAERFYSIAEDGLRQAWTGRVWMNPPYAQPAIGQFVDKLVEAFLAKQVRAAVVLVNNATETAWFGGLAAHAAAVCFPDGRVRFWSPTKLTASPLQGQAVIYLGRAPASFHARFAPLGTVWVKP